MGKSIVATNLAVALAQAGHEVVLCDLDLGAANLHLMLGVSRPKAGHRGPAGRRRRSLEEALTDTGIPRLKLLAGTGVTVAAANITHTQKLRIIRKLRGLTHRLRGRRRGRRAWATTPSTSSSSVSSASWWPPRR